MLKNKKAPKTVQKFYTLTPRNVEMIDELIEKKGYLSASEAVRAAIMESHKKHCPPYLEESAAGEERKKRLQQEETWEKMTDEEYAESIGAPVFDSDSGTRYALIHTIGNSVLTLPLTGLKDRLAKAEDLAGYHLEEIKQHKVEDRISEYTKGTLRQKYGLVI